MNHIQSWYAFGRSALGSTLLALTLAHCIPGEVTDPGEEPGILEGSGAPELPGQPEIRGALNCGYGSSLCNVCVNRVVSTFAGMPRSPTSKIRYKSRGGDNLPPFNRNLAAFGGNDSHVQTIARLPGADIDIGVVSSGPWFALSRARPGNPGGAGVFLVHFADFAPNDGEALNRSETGDPPSNRETVYYYPTADMDHPGGGQAMGRFFAVAVDCDEASKCGSRNYIDIYNFKEIGSPNALVQRVPVGAQGEQGNVSTITAVSMARLSSGQYLMFVLGKDNAHEGWFYISDLPVIVPSTRWNYAAYWKRSLGAEHNYQNVTMVTECGTGDLYMFGTGNAGYTVGAVIGSTFTGDPPGEEHIALLKIGEVNGQVTMESLGTRTFDPGSSEYCTFRAGATMHATPLGGMALYCSARRANTDALGRPDSKLKMVEYASDVVSGITQR